MIRWTTTNDDVVEVYASPARCLRTECTTAHREFRYRVRAANGEIVEQGSEGYTRKGDAAQAAERHHPRDEEALCGLRKPGGTTTCTEPAGHAGADGRGESHGDGSIIRWIYR